ncbi:MAG: acetyl-CoA carboxylase carboxyltransferase subunit alpha [Bdellovibrionota bacterium]|nr:acetyl-CoA carboxylase carboxyltransferase subunit alpha [Bdellovibrionota bacterium]
MGDHSGNYTLEFEKPVRELENQIQDLRDVSGKPHLDLSTEVGALQRKVDKLITEIYGNLSPWERVQLSRHPARPHGTDYIKNLISDFHEVHGDRKFADDPSIICGFGYLEGRKVAVLAIEKGRKTKDKVYRNFGMPRPEGYRKSIRVMKLAEQFNLPIVAFVDTPGAYPGIGAEERGQASAIAENLAEMFEISVPIISVVIGEGGSGGALGLAIADRVLMMEYSIYSVISPESCASILWADPKKGETAAQALKLSPDKALELGVIDKMVREPIGGAHRDHKKAYLLMKEALAVELKGVEKYSGEDLKKSRFEKFRKMGNDTICQVNSEPH